MGEWSFGGRRGKAYRETFFHGKNDGETRGAYAYQHNMCNDNEIQIEKK